MLTFDARDTESGKRPAFPLAPCPKLAELLKVQLEVRQLTQTRDERQRAER